MTRVLKNNYYILGFLFIILVYSINFLFVTSKTDDQAVSLKTVKGDESVIEDIEISGVIHDKSSGISFTLSNDQYHQKFKFYVDEEEFERRLTSSNNYYGSYAFQIRRDIFRYSSYYMLYNRYYIRDARIDLSKEDINNYREIYITKSGDYKLGKNETTKTVGIKTDIIMSSEYRSFNYGSYTTRFIEELDGKLYLAIPTDSSHKGKSGIYKVFDSDDKIKGTGELGYRKLADIDLEDGNITVEGMFALKDKLCVILFKKNHSDSQSKLILKSFDLKSEKFSGYFEMSMPNAFRQDGINGYSTDDKLSLVMDKVYTFKISDVISLLSEVNLDMIKERIKESEISRGFKTFKTEENRLKYVNVNYIDYAVRYQDVVLDVKYKNGRTYILYGFGQVEPNTSNWYLRGWCVLLDPDIIVELIVYNDEGELEFLGSIESNITDDRIWQSIHDIDILEQRRKSENVIDVEDSVADLYTGKNRRFGQLKINLR
ncbi:UNVERIFIED_CONTAM: hypothetical protein Cloal_0128 [Acetivibrio alkalicellulosi]